MFKHRFKGISQGKDSKPNMKARENNNNTLRPQNI